MLNFPKKTSLIRPLLTYEVVADRAVLDAVMRYLLRHARIDLATVFLSAVRNSEKMMCDHVLRDLGCERVLINEADVQYDGSGSFRTENLGMERAVLVSRRGVVLDVENRRRKQPSCREFAQACGVQNPFVTVTDQRASSVEMVSGFEHPDRQMNLLSVRHTLALIERARFAQRVTLAQLTSSEATGRLFGFRNEQPVKD